MKPDRRIDETDRRIIARLRRENVTNSTLARELGVSEGMIRRRLAKLKQSGMLRVRAGIDPDALDDQQLALVAVSINRASLLEEKARQIAGLPHVLSVSIVSGRYDLMLEVLIESNHGLVDFLTMELADVDEVTTTETFLALRSFGKFV